MKLTVPSQRENNLMRNIGTVAKRVRLDIKIILLSVEQSCKMCADKNGEN